MTTIDEQGFITLDNTHDLIDSPDDNGHYIQEYKMDGKGTSRNSIIYPTSRDAWTAYRDNTVKYKEWD